MSLETIFPLSFYHGKLPDISNDIHRIIREKINALLPNNLNCKQWFGDTTNNPCLHTLDEFKFITQQCEIKVKDYIDKLGFNLDELSCHHQRSWINLIQCGGNAPPHQHKASNLTFAYCFYKDKHSTGGNVIFDNLAYQNLIIPGIDVTTPEAQNLFKVPTQHNYTAVAIPFNTGDYLIFPSQTEHLTNVLDNTDENMIVLTYDILITTAPHVSALKYSFISPHPLNYKEF